MLKVVEYYFFFTSINKLVFTLWDNSFLNLQSLNGFGKTFMLKNILNIELKYNGYVHWKNKKKQRLKIISPFFLNKVILKQFINYSYKFGIEDKILIDSSLLSSGQKKKRLLIYLLLSKSNIWFLDEPETFLDLSSLSILNTKCLEHINSNGLCIVTSNKLFFKRWNNFKQNLILGPNGLEPLTSRLSSDCSTTKL